MSFTFLNVLEETMPQIAGNRFPNGPRGGFHTIPKFDPFQDHVTALVANDRFVQRKLISAWSRSGLRNPAFGRCRFKLDPEIEVMASKGVVISGYVPGGDVIINNLPTFRRMAATVEGRRYQKLVGGVTHTIDGRPIDDDGRVEETIFPKGTFNPDATYIEINRDKDRKDGK